jgi:DNA modification methylase/transcriptional regulator with XRE-family HTH domain
MKPDILTPFLDDADVILYAGDCVEVMKRMPESSVDAIVTDPPYGLEFMGKGWDGFGTPLGFQTWTEAWAVEAFRILKPGGHLLAFAGTRTYHRMASGVEDAGFEIRDCIAWMYGSGFPKSLDVSKAIDRRKDWKALPLLQSKVREARTALGISQSEAARRCGLIAEGESLGGGGFMWFETGMRIPTREQYPRLKEALALDGECDAAFQEAEREVTGTHVEWTDRTNYAVTSKDGLRRDIPATPEATKWNGWGTALKPAFEPVVVARRPLIGTVAANVLEHGTGALNIDACRIGMSDQDRNTIEKATWVARDLDRKAYGKYETDGTDQAMTTHSAGRWPANVALDATAAAMLDEQSGHQKDGTATRRNLPESGAKQKINLKAPAQHGHDVTFGGEGGASRFFYTAKASRQDRNVGGLADNTHPTVKPTDLMRWLIRLVTPPGGIILDPFGGSGSTGLAARAENVRCILIEREPEYLQIIRDRLAQQNLFATETTTNAT